MTDERRVANGHGYTLAEIKAWYVGRYTDTEMEEYFLSLPLLQTPASLEEDRRGTEVLAPSQPSLSDSSVQPERPEVRKHRVRRDAEVRQAPSQQSSLLFRVSAGKVVQQIGPERGSRVPIAPRGWIDAEALEPLVAITPRGWVDAEVLAPRNARSPLQSEIEQYLTKDDSYLEDAAIETIVAKLERATTSLGCPGVVKVFGSFANGFKGSRSDLDLTLCCSGDRPSFGSLAALLPDLGFDYVVKVSQAQTPLLKFTDRQSGMEIDFCMSQDLGVRNSLLMDCYCRFDVRVVQLGRLVKCWAKRHQLVGTSDGCLNSYAYLLLTVFYLQLQRPPVVPNLQVLATDPKPLHDRKWGCDDVWDTKFVEDVASLPPSENTMDTGELLTGFFRFFSDRFDWRAHSVCVRLGQVGLAIDKFSLATATDSDQWYIEDPFDLKHNLAGRCTREGRQRILREMQSAWNTLKNGGTWREVCPEGESQPFFLKCNISKQVTPEALLDTFQDGLLRLHVAHSRTRQVFFEFDSASARRKAHAKNESFVDDCQMHLLLCSGHGLVEARREGMVTTFETARVLQ